MADKVYKEEEGSFTKTHETRKLATAGERRREGTQNEGGGKSKACITSFLTVGVADSLFLAFLRPACFLD